MLCEFYINKKQKIGGDPHGSQQGGKCCSCQCRQPAGISDLTPVGACGQQGHLFSGIYWLRALLSSRSLVHSHFLADAPGQR